MHIYAYICIYAVSLCHLQGFGPRFITRLARPTTGGNRFVFCHDPPLFGVRDKHIISYVPVCGITVFQETTIHLVGVYSSRRFLVRYVQAHDHDAQ